MNRRFIAAITALILAMDFASAAEPVDDAVAAANRGDTVWFSLAAAHSAESDTKSRNEAIKGRDTIAPAMTRWELAEAQKRAAEWRPKLASARPLFAAKKPESEASSGTAFFVTPDGKA